MTELEKIHDDGEVNYNHALKFLGDTAKLPEDLVELYRLLCATSTKSKIAAQDDVVGPLIFLLSCQYALTKGCLDVLRGHITDAFRSLRMAIEAAAFAARVKRHPEFSLTWLNAGQSAEAYEEYRKRFSGGKIFPDEHALLKELGERYDHAAKQGHPSLYMMAGHGKALSSTAGFEFRFNYFQMKSDGSEPVRSFLWTNDTHFKIIKLFEEILADAIAHERKVWDEGVTVVEARLTEHKEKWKRFGPGQ